MSKKIIILSAIFFLFSGAGVVAQTVVETSSISGTYQQALQNQLDQIEAQIKQQEDILQTQQSRSDSLSKEVATLNATIKEYQLEIKARNISIQELTDEINQKQQTINDLSGQFDTENQSLAAILRKTNQQDSYSLAEFVLSDGDLGKFFSDINDFKSIKLALQDSFSQITDTKAKTTDQKTALESQKDDETSLQNLQKLQQERVQQEEDQENEILKASKGLEANYAEIIKEKALTATEIRDQLFSLQGSTAIPFDKAVQYATEVGQKIGIRPAFLLGVIAEESNLGENVGTGSWLIDMKSPRDTEPFLAITKNLGLDPDQQPVSKKAWYGYGGAMGPAQIIPSTWVLHGGYSKDTSGNWVYNASDDMIRQSLGEQKPSNPWDPTDAFTASAIILRDNGADAGTAKAERLAALRYLAGRANATKKAYAFYGDDVMALATKYQDQINILFALK